MLMYYIIKKKLNSLFLSMEKTIGRLFRNIRIINHHSSIHIKINIFPEFIPHIFLIKWHIINS